MKGPGKQGGQSGLRTVGAGAAVAQPAVESGTSARAGGNADPEATAAPPRKPRARAGRGMQRFPQHCCSGSREAARSRRPVHTSNHALRAADPGIWSHVRAVGWPAPAPSSPLLHASGTLPQDGHCMQLPPSRRYSRSVGGDGGRRGRGAEGVVDSAPPAPQVRPSVRHGRPRGGVREPCDWRGERGP